VLAAGAAMIRRAEARINRVALASSPHPVAVVPAQRASYRATRVYGGAFASWLEAGIGPQFLSAYVDTVLVRPGAVVSKGEVLATLDCRNANATTQAVAMGARAIAARQKAVEDEAAREQTMLDGGFVSPVEVEQKTASSAAQLAELEGEKAKLAQTSLTVNDCILRAPFDGEVATRDVDPGAFVRPGDALVALVDRSIVRFAAEAPETDFDILKPGTAVAVRVYATGQDVTGTISRRAPSMNRETRTVHFEVDVPDPKREIPANTSGEVHIEAGEPVPASEVPLYAASVSGDKAVLFVVEHGVIQTRSYAVTGESGGSLYVDPSLAPGTLVVAEGRELLREGDAVAAQEVR
jgi:RND family efflux transporter MFP subunit